MKSRYTIAFIGTVCLLSFSIRSVADETKDEPTAITVVVGHRVHTDFREVLDIKMHERVPIGDTEYWFEVVRFEPHFAIIDSTKQVVSLSDELKNVAFKIEVYEDNEAIDKVWAFYSIDIPHYARTSLIKFDVVAFEYRDEVHKKEHDGSDDEEM